MAGEELLEFCSMTNLTIMKTFFEKPQMHLATWKHPAMQQSHTIDFVVKRIEQWKLCGDVRVCRSACCWTDHYLVRGKVCYSSPGARRARAVVPWLSTSLATVTTENSSKRV